MSQRWVLYVLAVSLAIGALGSCGHASDPSEMTSAPAWSAVLDVRVGSIDTPGSTLTYFRDIEVGSDGSMYTVHPQEQLIRVFAADGSLRDTIGGEGDGPGEFQNVGGIGWVGDTLWVLDYQGYRFSQFDAAGTYLGQFSVAFESTSDPRAVQPPRARGLLYDGTVHAAPPAFSNQIAAGTLTLDVPMLMDREGRVTDTLPATPFGRNQWAIGDPDAPERGGLYRPQPFGDGPIWAYGHGERAVYVLRRPAPESSTAARATLSKLSFGGDTLYSRSYYFPRIPVTVAEADSVAADVGDMMGERGIFGVTAAKGREWAAASLYHPAYRPPVTSMVVARSGGVWLEMSAPQTETGSEWLVVDGGGVPLARVSLPAGIDVLLIDLPYVWASERDDFDVPYLLRFRVTGM